MCLPTCPTFEETGIERNSPRGRISLMRAIADGELEATRTFAEEMYYCLGCLACQTACPADVKYATLFETARAEIEKKKILSAPERNFWRWLTLKTIFMHPRLLRLLGRFLFVYQTSRLNALLRRVHFFGLLPKHLAELEPLTPTIRAKFSHDLIAHVERPKGPVRYRVALLTGCVQDLAFSEINRDTADVLLANSCEVVTPPVQPCCGSLHAHNGEPDLAANLARKLIDLMPPSEFDAIISNAGGCGSHLKKYSHLLAGDPAYAERARQWDKKLRDIHEWLVEIGFRKPVASPFAKPTRVTYHESCHLCHGQRVVTQPRQILRALPGVEYVELAESNWCCGSAGIYNITQPEQARKLQVRKTKHLAATYAECAATANPGCHLQLVNGLAAASIPMRVEHPVSLLARAYRNESASSKQ